MNYSDLKTTIRRKLRVTDLKGSAGVCQHARTNRTICGVVHGNDGGSHATKCNIGGEYLNATTTCVTHSANGLRTLAGPPIHIRESRAGTRMTNAPVST